MDKNEAETVMVTSGQNFCGASRANEHGGQWTTERATSNFWSLWGFIGSVSAYDAWLVVLVYLHT